MDRVSNRRLQDFPAVTLYVDDLEEIVALFTTACERVEIETGVYRTSDPSELAAIASKFHNGRFPEVKIQGHQPYVNVELLPHRARAYISEDSDDQRDIISKVRDVLNRRKKLKPGLIAGLFNMVLIGVSSVLITDKQFTSGFILAGLGISCLPIIVNLSMNNTVVVATSRLSDRSSFFIRKRGDLILLTISAVVAGAIVFAVAMLTKR